MPSETLASAGNVSADEGIKGLRYRSKKKAVLVFFDALLLPKLTMVLQESSTCVYTRFLLT